jgi:perosamine synthetase
LINQVEPNFDSLESEYITSYFNSGGWATENKVTKDFEQKIASYVGMKFAVAVPSGTIALYLAVLSLNLKKSSRIAVPNITMVATINAILWAGHNPVIVDTDEDMCMSLESLEEVEDIKAIMYVPLNGKSGNAIEIKKYCKKKQIFMIEDSAHALGSKYDENTFCGSLGDLSIISFTPHKIMTTGQGGMVLTDNQDFYDFLVQMKSFNRTKDKSDFHEGFGLNFKFTDIQATIGISQFSKLEHFIDRKMTIQNYYKESLDSKKFNIVEFTEYELPWFYTIKLNEVKIEELISYLSSKKIESRMLYPPLNKQHFLEEYANVDITSSLNTFEKYLWLPSSTKLTDEQLEYISSTLNSF